MRARVLAGIRRWWSNAGKLAGHRFPGHPHWLDCAVAGIDARDLLPSGPQATGNSGPHPSLAHPVDGKRAGQLQDGPLGRLAHPAEPDAV